MCGITRSFLMTFSTTIYRYCRFRPSLLRAAFRRTSSAPVRVGYVYAFDRQTGELLWKTPVGIHNEASELDAFPAPGHDFGYSVSDRRCWRRRRPIGWRHLYRSLICSTIGRLTILYRHLSTSTTPRGNCSHLTQRRAKSSGSRVSNPRTWWCYRRERRRLYRDVQRLDIRFPDQDRRPRLQIQSARLAFHC